ncbi:alpha/beta hydrolase [Kamptonema formosum]|uniref:alpha/beta hydrolase n=1 Tax=Kamptonema formosum TaxID=331992 RepID=UPI00034B6AE4|nr:alpha/beta hydrolase [Oscillatoria sp. PCC 10802]
MHNLFPAVSKNSTSQSRRQVNSRTGKPLRQPPLTPPPRRWGGGWGAGFFIPALCNALMLLPAVLSATKAVGAERIYASYSVLERSISVSALEAYAKEGKIDEDLAAYLQYFPREQQQQLRQALLARADLSPITISQFLYTPQGEIALKRLGQVIQTGTRQPGKLAIRAALILAAADPEGLTPINVLRKFPTDGIRIDLARALDLFQDLQQVVNQSNRATAFVERLSQAQVHSQPGIRKFSQSDLSQLGPLRWQTLSINVTISNSRLPTAPVGPRVFPADIYLPQLQGETQPAPVIVISHGLGSDRKTFQYLAEHLASYGFAVAVPQHPGSDARQFLALVNGTASEVAEPAEFIARPLDVKYLLDALAELEKTDPALRGRLNLEQVGVVGQSFGGYTSLALAGAPIDFQQLQADCQNLDTTWNISLLLQCRALELPRLDYQLGDPRIKAALAINPVDSSILGPKSLSQIKVPVMLVASGADTAAPALPEQIRPFTWLRTPNKYLVLIGNGTHFSTLVESESDPVKIPAEVIGPSPALAYRYASALSLAFFQTYIANQPQYRLYLQPSYISTLSRNPLPLSLIESLSESDLQQALKDN